MALGHRFVWDAAQVLIHI